MIYSILRRTVERRLRRAIRAGLPQWAAAHVRRGLSYAAWKRNQAEHGGIDRTERGRYYTRAVHILAGCGDLLDAYLHRDA